MRCRFCGSEAIHGDTENKGFSVGKAVAGTMVFGSAGAVAGITGKKVEGLRCSACGAFMESPMDYNTEKLINDAIYSAKKGSFTSTYKMYKKQYPNIETVNLNETAETGNHSARELALQNSRVIEDKSNCAISKRRYYYGIWQPECPIFISYAIIKTIGTEDALSLEAISQNDKTIRSIYLDVIAYDDTGEELTRNKCVYQGLALATGEPLPEDKSFGLNTDLAYKVDIFCEKVAFTDDSVWKADPELKTIHLDESEAIVTDTFPRYKYMSELYRNGQKNGGSAKNLEPHYYPNITDQYWTCTCGVPVRKGKICPVCKCKEEAIAKAFNQDYLAEIQKETVISRAKERAKAIQEKAETARKIKEEREQKERESAYEQALELAKAGSISSLKSAINTLEPVRDYKDSSDLIAKYQKQITNTQEQERIKSKKAKKKKTLIGIICGVTVATIIAVSLLITKVIIPSQRYKQAVVLMEEEKYDEAIVAFESLKGYKDSNEKIEGARAAKLDAWMEKNYEKAAHLFESGEFEEAIQVFSTLGDYKDSSEQIEKCKTAINEEQYQKAVDLVNNGEYKAAAEIFQELEDFKDSRKQLEIIQENPIVSDIIDFGTKHLFGSYEQDNNLSNGKEPIEWIVLKEEENRKLLVSKYLLDIKEFNDEDKSITWEKCTLRSWLNRDFLDSAFSEEEQKYILNTKLKNNTADYGDGVKRVSSGNDTEDNIFLLSFDEFKEYSAQLTDVDASAYAKNIYNEVSESKYKKRDWWLRSMGIDKRSAIIVDPVNFPDGPNGKPKFVEGRTINAYVNSYVVYVRPAMWVEF